MSIVAETATLAHGYTMADVARIARFAVRKGAASNPREGYENAWMAIVERLYDPGYEAPTNGDLFWVGVQAIRDEAEGLRRSHGRTRDGDERPSFEAYWEVRRDADGRQVHTNDNGFAEGLIERLALPQVLALLTPNEWEGLAALAVHDCSMTKAAASVGIGVDALRVRVTNARQKIIAAWMAPEQPPVPHDSKTHCKYGHDRAIYGRVNAAGARECTLCIRNNQRRHNARNRGSR